MITASAPGKILLIGGYSVLERPNFAYVLAVDAYVHATVKPRKDDKILIDIPQFKITIETTTSEIGTQNNIPAKFVLNAIKIVLDYLKFKHISVSGFEITTQSDKQFSVEGGKSGLGSSAAVTVATVAAILKLFKITDIDLLHTLAQYAHALSQGKVGSGFDVAASCFGSVGYSRYSPEKLTIDSLGKLFETELDYDVMGVNMPPGFKLLAASFPKDSMSTTFSVNKVMEFKKNNKNNYLTIMDKLNEANEEAIDSLEMEDLNSFVKFFEEGRVLTKELGKLAGVGIETDEHTKLIEESKQNGAFVCKLPGAGGGDSIVALCKSEQDKINLKKFWKKKGLKILDVNVISSGLRVETGS
ncbi:MAG: hypothetical protein Q7S22_03590 [Candidatus Micrarchaeota archaeon]|nr:hypothetical protein [Candidatus Micrarchaeota archaeon]